MAAPNYEAIQQDFNGVVYARAARDAQAEIRAESRLFDTCLANGMSFDEPDHITWAAVQIGEWLSTGNA